MADTPAAARLPLDTRAAATMILLTAIWGMQQVAIKLAAPSVPLVMQASIRSAVATVLVVAWARSRGLALVARDGTLAPGLAAGLLFGAEFAFIYAGLGHTTAARMVVLLYLAPCFTALGLAWLVPGEHLAARQWVGIGIAFAGTAFAFADGFAAPGRPTLAGDAMAIVAAVLWAATTVLIRASTLARASATKVLAYQLAVSAAVLAAVSFLLGESWAIAPAPVAWASLAFQAVVVAFASYLAWFWLLTRYLASRLSVFSFATPLFGVAFAHLVLGETVSARFAVAALLVAAGIALVNAGTPAPRAAPSGAPR
ncbi:MAG: DMT family transporter [Burkholderiales bacterium]